MELNYKTHQVASIKFNQSFEERNFRLVIKLNYEELAKKNHSICGFKV